jgi:CspA family cold shock protein
MRVSIVQASTKFSVCLAQLPVLGRSQVISQNSDHLCIAQARNHSNAERTETTMATGTVKWFNPTKGYGFIQPQGGGKDVFVHISAVERAGLNTLNEGQTVQYEVVSNRGKESAENLKVG